MPDLTKNMLGDTGLNVTRLGFGAMEIRGAPRGRDVTPEQADTILNAVLDAGINYIDTSIDYGTSEEFIGRFISSRRDEFFLASKCGCKVGAPPPSQPGPSAHEFTRENVIEGVEQSLRRMKTDYMDVVQFHISPSMETLNENGALEALQELQQQGKVRHIGMSGTLPNLPEQIDSGAFAVLQIPYSALERKHEALISTAAAKGIGNVIRGGVAKGEPGESGVAGRVSWDSFEQAKLGELLDSGESRTSFMLRFTISHPGMHTTIVGTINPDHLQQNVDAVERGPLSDDVYAEAKKRLTEVGQVPAAS
jgi:aryl-alcohol dehydrogenase-like predicted oxidoreductase